MKELSGKFTSMHPADMFYQNHMKQLRKYVDKSEEFRGEIVFFQNNVVILKPENMIKSEGCSYLNIKSVNLANQLDLLPEDVDDY